MWLCSFLWTVMISPAILMETLQPLFLLKHVQCWKCFASWVLRYLKPSSSWILTEFPTAWIWKKGLLTKISFSFRTTSSLLQLSSARRNKVREWRQSCIQNFISFLSSSNIVIVFISLQNNCISSGFNGTFTARPPSHAFPMLIIFCTVRFVVLEALLILNDNWISDRSNMKERSIDKDFVFGQNNAFNVPVVLCKNKSKERSSIQNFLSFL